MSDGPGVLTQARGGTRLSVASSPSKVVWPGCSMAGVRLHNSSDSDAAVVVGVVDEENSDSPPLTSAEMADLLGSGNDLGFIWGELMPGNSGWIPFGGRTGSSISLYLWTKEGTAEVGAIFCR